MFSSSQQDLKDILKEIDKGQLQLPDFQRDDDVRSLIASVAKAFPVGALLTLETGGDVAFKPRLLEGVEPKETKPATLLLDGQQRMTSLYQAMSCKKPVRTHTARGMEVERFYYLDMTRAIAGGADLDDAIIGVPADRIVRTNFGKSVVLDVSSKEAEFAQDLFPLNQVFDIIDWLFGWKMYWNERGRDTLSIEHAFMKGVVEAISHYEMPIIKLGKDNSREAICLVFEKVNVGGKKLDAFELVTAIYAADSFDLRADWSGTAKPAKTGRRVRMIGSPNPRDVLAEIASTDFLQACTLLHTREIRLAKFAAGLRDKDLPQISCKRETLLALPLAGYKQHADAVEAGFVETSSFLNELKIIWHKDIPYPPQLVALAAVFALLGHKAQTAAARGKLAQWFWSVTLGELYSSTTESQLAKDVPELIDWIGGGQKPDSVDRALFQEDRLRSLRSRQSAAYKGLHALIMGHGCRDFITGKPADLMTFFHDSIDIHHIFPQKWCGEHGIKPAVYNAIVNKTPLSRFSNISIGGDAPSVYLKRIEKQQGITPDALDAILCTHLIDPTHLRNDDFEAFFNSRLKALAALISVAMDKPTVEAQGANEDEVEIDPSGSENELDQEVA